jgi:hypothetical protein
VEPKEPIVPKVELVTPHPEKEPTQVTKDASDQKPTPPDKDHILLYRFIAVLVILLVVVGLLDYRRQQVEKSSAVNQEVDMLNI